MLPRFFASYYLRRDRYTDTEPSSPRGPSSRRKTTRSRDRRSVSKGLRGNALTSLLPTTRLTHVCLPCLLRNSPPLWRIGRSTLSSPFLLSFSHSFVFSITFFLYSTLSVSSSLSLSQR